MAEFKNSVWKKARRTYNGIIQRCTNPNRENYPRYGGRGIRMLIPKEDFINWYIRTAKGRVDLTVDRIDNGGDYELDNIRLVPRSENTRTYIGTNMSEPFTTTIQFPSVRDYGKLKILSVVRDQSIGGVLKELVDGKLAGISKAELRQALKAHPKLLAAII